jgi:hypothetical protein
MNSLSGLIQKSGKDRSHTEFAIRDHQGVNAVLRHPLRHLPVDLRVHFQHARYGP